MFGRKILAAELPLDMVKLMRAVAEGQVAPLEAVKAYHDTVRRQGLAPKRDLAADSEITEAALRMG